MREKPSLIQVMRPWVSVIKTALEVCCTTWAKRFKSAVMPSANCSARRRLLICWYSRKASMTLINAPEPPSNQGEVRSMEASKRGVLPTRRATVLPGKDKFCKAVNCAGWGFWPPVAACEL